MKTHKFFIFNILSVVYCLCLLHVPNQVIAQNGLTRAIEVLWSEDWTGGSAGQTPAQYMSGTHSGTVVYGGGSVTYSSTDGSSGGTKLYNETLAGGTSPELLLGKSGGTWTVSGIPTGGATSMTLTFNSNSGVNEITATNGVTVSSITTSSRSCTLSNPNGASSFNLTFTRSNSSNTRLDNFVLTADINLTPYNLTVDPSITNGTVTLSHSTATEGTTITVTTTPAAGYRLGHITYTPNGGSEIIISGNTFSMPASDVEVSAVFVLEGTDGFEKVTEALTDWSGDYILAYKGNGYLDALSSINKTVTSYYGNHINILQYLHADNITVEANATTLGMVIHIEPSNGYYTLYLTGSGYLGYDTDNSGSNAQAKSITSAATVISNRYRWSINFTGGAVVISNAATPTRMLQYDIYNTPRKYACFEKNSNVVNADLYKYYETIYNIQASGDTGVGGVSINGENVNQKDIPSGKKVTLSATLDYCYGFLGWYDANTNTLVSTDNPYVFTASNDVNLIAKTEALTEHTYTLNLNVTGSGNVAINGNNVSTFTLTSCEQPVVTLTATPTDVSWSFDGWYIGNTLLSGTTPYEYIVPAGSTTLTARFSARSIYINPPSGAYPAGTVVTIMTNPSAAFRYTTDGSAPTNTSLLGNGSATYTLTTSTTVNAALTSSLGNVTSETYIVPKQKDPEGEAEGLHLNKYLNGNFDNNCSNPHTDCNYAFGNGQITLESYTTASVEAAVTNEPTDFIFVLDYSDIMTQDFESGITRLDAMKNAVSDFLVTLSNNPSAYAGHDHRVGFLTFNSWGYLHYRNPNNDQLMYFYHEIDDQPTTTNINGTGWQRYVLARSNCLFSFGDPNYDPFWAWDLLKNSVTPSTGNMPDRAMAMIEDIFNYNGAVDYTFTANGETKTRRRIIITFTDGVPGYVTSHNGDWTFPSVANDGCGYTTITGRQSTPVANKTLSYMSDLKSDYGAVSYTIGILPNADGTGSLPDYQESDGTYSYYLPSEQELTLNANRFLHLLSSNSSTASNLCSNDWNNKNFYIAANNLNELANAFSNIAASVNPDIALSSEGIVQDIMSEYFVIPAATQETDIQTFTQEFLGLNGTGDTIWGPLVPINVTVHFSPDHKTILETGFDYGANAIYFDESTMPPTPHGNKLVIIVPVIFETDEEAVCGTYPTNDWVSGVFDGTGEPLAEFNNPMADVRYGKKEKTIEETVCDSYTWHGTTYTESGIYHFDTIATNGCDSTVYLNLTVNYSEDVVLDPVTICDSYTWHGTTYNSSGTHIYTTTTDAGCQRTEMLVLTVNHSNTGIDTQVACGSFTWIDGITYTESNYTATFTETNQYECDSVVTLNLTINNPVPVVTTEVACESYTWINGDGQTYTTSGNYTYTHTDANGCTQVDTLHLTINNPAQQATTVTACETYTWANGDGQTYTTSGNYTYTHTDANGCTQVDTLHLTINNPVPVVTTEVACESYTWINGDGQTYTTSGNYTYSHTDANGCTQVDTLHLTINNPIPVVTTEVACESYTWANGDGQTYTTSGNYTYTHTDGNGCTQVDTLHLTINNPVPVVTTEVACESYTWINGDGQTYTTSGNYTYTHTDANGCTQVDTLHLTINNGEDVTLEPVTVCDSYEWYGETYTESATLTHQNTNDEGCSFTETLVITVNHSNTGIDTQVACGSFTWIDGVTYTESNYTATFTETNQYECDSVVTLNLTINNPVPVVTTEVACESYTWANGDGQTYTTSGNYTYSHTDNNGCTQVDTLHLTINNPVPVVTTEVACESYTWASGDGQTYTTSGNYTYSHTDANGCTQVDTLHLTINNPVPVVTTEVACESYTWSNGDGQTYTTSGNYTYTHTNANGCTQVDTLHLTINNPVPVVTTEVACESYTWANGDGQTYTTSGNYTYTHTDANGCTQVDTLHLTINNPVPVVTTEVACESYTWINGDGQTYTTSGNYTYTHTDANGCTQVDTLHLTINNGEDVTLDPVTVCDSYEWYGVTYTESATLTHQNTNDEGCSFTETLVLTVNHSNTGIDTQVACGSFTWIDGVTYTESNSTATFTETNQYECDSVVTLNLTINNPVPVVTTEVACESYTWANGDGQTYTTSGDYTYSHTDDNGCTQVDTLHLTINNPVPVVTTEVACESYIWANGDGQTYTTSGNYTYTHTDANGCTQVDTLHLTINNPVPVVTTEVACESYTWSNGDGQTYTTSGNYTYTHTNANGCTQVDTLHLTINNGEDVTLAPVTVCDSYEWYGETYTESATLTHQNTNDEGCSFTETLVLTVNHSNTGIDTQVACGSFTWIDGITYTESNNTATFTETNQYECDSVITLNLTINNPVPVVTTEVACDSYTWVNGDGQTYTTSGNYTYSHTDNNGCIQVDTLHLTINNPVPVVTTEVACESYTWNHVDGTSEVFSESGTYTYSHNDINGCTQVDTLHLTINNPVPVVTTEVACESYTWANGDGQTYTTSGNYTYTHTDANGCTQVDTLHLTINNPVPVVTTEVACESYTWTNGDGHTYTTSGNYTYTHTDANGCTQVDTLHLTINNSVPVVYDRTACDSYTWNHVDGTSEVLSESGTYTYSHNDDNGCIQVDTLHLTINNGEDVTLEPVTVCDSYEWYGETYTESATLTHQNTNDEGCSFTETLVLTVNHSNTGIDTQVACGSFTWIDGITYTESNYTATFTETNQYECDSVVTLNLTINNPVPVVTTEVACDSYTWANGDGQTYTTSGNYTYSHTDANGCTQVDTLHLTINNPVPVVTTEVACESYTWANGDGQTYTTSGNYTYSHTDDNGCTQVDTLHLTINNPVPVVTTEVACESYTWNHVDGTSEVFSESGTYTYSHNDINGCTQVDTLHLTINNPVPVVTTEVACESYTWANGDGQTYTTSGNYTYTHTDANGCTQVDTLHLTINNPVPVVTTEVACESYTWANGDGQTYTTSGDYTYTHTDANGCTQVDTLHLTVNNPVPVVTTEVACESYIWANGDGQTYTTSGNYTYSHTDANGCTQVDTLHLTINNPVPVVTTEVACDSYTWANGDGQTYTTSGNYTYSHTDNNGCTQVDTLHLTINNPVPVVTTEVACESYIWANGDGQTYTTSGNYTYTHTDANGCTQVDTLHLTINNPVPVVTTEVACESYTWANGDGQTYTTSGNYTYTHTDANGCTQVDTLHLTINNGEDVTLDPVTVCDSYEWYGETYTESATLTHQNTNDEGCSFTETLVLTVNHSDESTAIVTGCDNYIWNGVNYTESGIYEYHTHTVLGCDSVARLDLTISNSEYSVETVEYCDSYLWNGQEYTTSGTYTYQTLTDSGCERIETLNLVITESPYFVIEGDHNPVGGSETSFSTYNYEIVPQNTAIEFDSIVWSIDNENWYIDEHNNGMDVDLHIFTWLTDTVQLVATVYNECGSQTYYFWIRTSYYGVEDNTSEDEITITPNPNHGRMTISIVNLQDEASIKVFDLTGNLVDTFVIENETYLYEMRKYAVGMYNFVITYNNKIVTKKVIVK